MAVPTTTNPILNHLPKDDVLLSSELIALLRADGASEANARQKLRRTANSDGIWRSERLRLPKDERLFSRRAFVGTLEFYDRLGKKLLASNRNGLARCLEALGSRQVLHKTDLMRLLAVSEAGTGRDSEGARRLYRQELAGLEEIGATVLHRNTVLECVVGPRVDDGADLDELANRAAAAVRKESVLARILADRLRRQNMFSWDRVEWPDPARPYAVFNGQVFSTFAFSYLSPLVRWKKDAKNPTPCPVLFDVYVGRCVLSHVLSFLQRIDRATLRGRSHLPVLGVIAASDFDREAWLTARRRGLMTVSLRQAFGDEAIEAMVLVEELLHGLSTRRSSAKAKRDFLQFAHLLQELKTNPIVTAIRSIGFEALTGLTLRTLGYDSVELGRVAPWQNTTRDIDAFGMRGDELRVVECKAYHRSKSLAAEDVTKFFTQAVPALKKLLRVQGRVFTSCTAEIWTTGPLGRQAREALHTLQRPGRDIWELRALEAVQELLPASIRERGKELLSNIAMAQTDEHATDEIEGIDQMKGLQAVKPAYDPDDLAEVVQF